MLIKRYFAQEVDLSLQLLVSFFYVVRHKIDLFVLDVDRYVLQSELCHVALVKSDNFLNNVAGCLIENSYLSVVNRHNIVRFNER